MLLSDRSAPQGGWQPCCKMNGLVTHFTPGPGSHADTQTGLPPFSLSTSLLSPPCLFPSSPTPPPPPSPSFLSSSSSPSYVLWVLLSHSRSGSRPSAGPSPAPAVAEGLGSACQLLRALALGSNSRSGTQGKKKAPIPLDTYSLRGCPQ